MGDFNQDVRTIEWPLLHKERMLHEQILPEVPKAIASHIKNKNGIHINGIFSQSNFDSARIIDFSPWDYQTMWGIFALQGMFGYAYKPPCP